MSTTATLLAKAIYERPKNFDGENRRMGIEVEFAGLDADQICTAMTESIGGKIEWISPFEVQLHNDELGTFKLELDSQQVKDLGDSSDISGNPNDAEDGLEKSYIKTVSSIATNFVPWEIVTPPMELSDVHRLYDLVDRLRELGALGTRKAIRYAFGVHLNPEPTELSADHISRSLKSFFCLYEWLTAADTLDLSRRVTPYIDHFKNDYILKILDADYKPDMGQLIDDYLLFNPTRNRSLDMLPMFAFIDEEKVRQRVDDARVNARPTFHYRLPNCDIDNPDWNLDRPIELWMAVEELAISEKLQDVCDKYIDRLNEFLPSIGKSWPDYLAEMLPLPGGDR